MYINIIRKTIAINDTFRRKRLETLFYVREKKGNKDENFVFIN